MKSIRLLLPVLFMSMHAHACLWVDGTALDGHRHSMDREWPGNQLKYSLSRSPEYKLEWFKRNRTESSEDEFANREMDGVAEVLKGRPGDAIGIFLKIEDDQPGRYSTAANLGTAYELKGDLEPALRWITEGIRRNPDSHHGTEWLHQEIIRVRMKLADDPNYLQVHPILPRPSGVSKASQISIDGVAHTINEVEDALAYQLNERMIFVKPPDPVVADLLFSLGVLQAQTHSAEAGITLLHLART